MTKAAHTKIAVKANKSGKSTFALMKSINHWGEDAGYGVWKLCVNYVRGQDVKTWRYVEQHMTLEAATELFNKRTK